MKKSLKSLAIATILLSFAAACQQELEPQAPDQFTHTVTFVAGEPETKTVASIDGSVVKYSWTEGDLNRITLWENGVEGTVDKDASSVADGKMTITASFAGEAVEGDKTYTAIVNTSTISTQCLLSEAYDEDADVLVAKPVTSSAASGIQFQFKREVAIAKMTLKNLDANEVINSVKITSDKDLAGTFDGTEWTSISNSIDVASEAYFFESGYSIQANESGEAVVWFTCIPQDAATLSVKVEAADGDTYTKEFSKTITLTQGNVKAFGVVMGKDAKVVPSYSIKFYSTTSGEQTVKTTTQAATFITEGTKYVTTTPYSGITWVTCKVPCLLSVDFADPVHEEREICYTSYLCPEGLELGVERFC